MNDEQINEVMRRYGICAGSSSEWSVHEVGAGRKSLEAYLRTIGEPENTFPLNPNAASKWAHLQKHDGAEAIGVVFRTGSGSVGSLVDGRVVWADWLAHPNGSKPESVNAELLAIVHQTVGMIENTSIETGCCCCGDGMDGHASPMICGHSATDQGAYLAGLLYEDAKAAIARAESAIETPAKVSPCAGHAVQQDADASRDWPEDFPHENGQYMNTCHVCKNTFIGHKHRVVCKVCKVRNNGFIRAQQEADEAGGA